MLQEDLSEAIIKKQDAYAVQKGFLKAPAEQPARIGQQAAVLRNCAKWQSTFESDAAETAQNQSDKPVEASAISNWSIKLSSEFWHDEAFNQKLQELSQLYGVGPETFSYNPATEASALQGMMAGGNCSN